MLRIKIELDSAITGEITELGQAVIYNDGSGTRDSGNYHAMVQTLEGEVTGVSIEHTKVTKFPRLERDAWDLLYLVLQQLRSTRNG